MSHPDRGPVSRILHVGVAAGIIGLGAAGCGQDKADVSAAVKAANDQLAPSDARLNCPKEVDDSSEPFDCTVTGRKTGKTAPVKFKIEGDTITPADDDAFQQALEQVAPDQ